MSIGRARRKKRQPRQVQGAALNVAERYERARRCPERPERHRGLRLAAGLTFFVLLALLPLAIGAAIGAPLGKQIERAAAGLLLRAGRPGRAGRYLVSTGRAAADDREKDVMLLACSPTVMS